MNDEFETDDEQGEQQSDGLKGEETIGEILLSTRERLNLSLEQVSTETKIPYKMLEHLETDNFEALPAKVYARGFLRAYAGRLGLDVDYILDKYEVQTGQTHKSKGDLWEIETEVIEEKLEGPRIFKRFVLPVIVVVIVVLVVVWVAGRRETTVEPPASLPDIGSERIEQREHTGTDREPEGETVALAVADTAAAIETTSTEVITETPVEHVPEPIPAGLMRLHILAHEADSCWFELLLVSSEDSRSDTTLKMFLLMPGEVKIFEATDAFIFQKVGNPGSFDLELNGKRLDLLTERGRVRSDVTITPDDIPSE